MLVHYHVKNYALIEDAEIDFGPGLNVLTGETGAGKSILIDALSAGLGLRAGAEVIRKGCDFALVELLFAVSGDLAEKLRAMDVETEDDGLLISRKILPGRSIFRINDETVTSARVKAVTELLLDIHGQHEHQSLLKPARQLEIVDEYAGPACREAKSAMEEAYWAHKAAKEALARFSLSEEERLRRLDFLNYEIEEIENAAVQPGEREGLTARYREMAAFEKIESGLGQSLNYLCEGRENIADMLMRAEREVTPLIKTAPALQEILDELISAGDILSDAGRSIRSYLEESRFEPEALRQAENRLDELNRLELKYGDLCNPGNTALAEREAERDRLEDYAAGKEAARAELDKAEEEQKRAAEKLHELRSRAAPELDKALYKALKELNFLSVEVETRLDKLRDPGPGGWDEASFMISLNPGEELMPLRKVASGGELSRIMLAIKTILADKDQIPTVIFDEIDSGISGQTAELVGRKLKEISRSRQVILITHLPQIAAPADEHFGIEKHSLCDRTVTRIRPLKEEDSVAELARLLGGTLISENVLSAARELKKAGSAH